MTLDGQGEAFEFIWIDRSSAEVARAPPAGVSSSTGTAASSFAGPCFSCSPEQHRNSLLALKLGLWRCARAWAGPCQDRMLPAVGD